MSKAKEGPDGARLRARHCCQRGGSWVIDYELLETPPADLLRLLGHPAPP